MLSVILILKMHVWQTRSFFKMALSLSVVFIMGNLGALIDHFLHPGIFYVENRVGEGATFTVILPAKA